MRLHVTHSLSLIGALVILAGCGRQALTASPVGDAKSLFTQQFPAVSHKALIYATGGCGGTCVFTYAPGEYVGALSDLGTAACSDSSGNVYLPSDNQVVEYAHGGTSPIATLSLPGSEATGGCSIDPATGNLAVVFYIPSVNNNVAIFRNGTAQATYYATRLLANFPSYDNKGNLFVNGFVKESPGLAELPSGASSFIGISVPKSVLDPGQIQWDGKYLAWDSGATLGPRIISRLSVSDSKATVKSVLTLPVKGYASQTWLYKGTITVPFSNHICPRQIDILAHPGMQEIAHIGPNKRYSCFQGVTVSLPGK